MKTTILLALLAFGALLPASAGASNVTVTLTVGDHYHFLPAAKTCTLAVPAGTSGAGVLDAATATGCISGWAADDFGSPGEPNRFVTCVDGRCQDGTFYWVFTHNGSTLTTSYGVDARESAATQGATYDFRYATLASFFLP
jgi:hypothetical protein